MFDLKLGKDMYMLEVKKYSVAELSAILGSAGKQAIDRKLERYGIEFTSSGWADNRVYEIRHTRPSGFREDKKSVLLFFLR